MMSMLFFFFQAEDGIRDYKVTGVQTCALPISFATEEPTRFGIGCLGSRLLSGTVSADAAGRLTDGDGESLDEVRRKAGLHGNLQDVKLPTGYYKAFLELHIEQGPLLERTQTPLGIVMSIAAPASLRISVEGAGGHAGGVLMPDRKDALCAAAELVLAIENAARTSGAGDTVATVGVCEVFPGAVNRDRKSTRSELQSPCNLVCRLLLEK